LTPGQYENDVLLLAFTATARSAGHHRLSAVAAEMTWPRSTRTVPTMTASVYFDHLAVGVRTWPDGFRRFAAQLGGQWSHGGDAGEFAPCQLMFPPGINVELIAPGGAGQGFMHRFIDRAGPGPHHITFKVRSLEAALGEISALGIGVLDGSNRHPYWQEAFLHPKQCGIGTLLQLVQSDDAQVMGLARTPPPDTFPVEQGPAGNRARSVVWVGLTVESVDRARELFVGALQGTVAEDGHGWLHITWGPGRDLLVRSGDAIPGGASLWSGRDPGVAHVVFGDGELTVRQLESGDVPVEPMPFDAATAVPVWLAAGVVAERVQ
jgi:methylmalonyl-CoA/ethylmalonyl-CoA epimerase